jgi:phytoene dehydrogenase-like protein
MEDVLGPLRAPRHPLGLARFGLSGLRSARGLARGAFETERARGLVAGLAGHSMLPLEAAGTAAFGLVLGVLGHAVGWPIAVGGSRRIADALVSHLTDLGGEVVTSRPVCSLQELPRAGALLFDVAPRHLVRIAGSRLPDRYRRQILRYRQGPGAFKLDWALDGPIPWASPECAAAGTLHLGGTMAEIAASERAVADGTQSERPFVILAQQSRFDPTRAPPGKHTAWAYCHVPNGARVDMTEAIEAQVERFAPGFRDLILERHATDPSALESYNPNYVGGDINGGSQDLRQLFARPVARLVPYTTPSRDIYLCSSATPPGGGVHGMCGYFAARAALRRSLKAPT